MANRVKAWLTALLVAGAALTGCNDDNTPVCVPLEAENDCLCHTGAWGHRTCNADGLGYGECICGSGGAGAGGMAGSGGTGGDGATAGDGATGGVDAGGAGGASSATAGVGAEAGAAS